MASKVSYALMFALYLAGMITALCCSAITGYVLFLIGIVVGVIGGLFCCRETDYKPNNHEVDNFFQWYNKIKRNDTRY